MDRIGIVDEEASNKKSDTRLCPMPWSDRTICNSLGSLAEMCHAVKHQSRSPKDDSNILQLISAGLPGY